MKLKMTKLEILAKYVENNYHPLNNFGTLGVTYAEALLFEVVKELSDKMIELEQRLKYYQDKEL